MKVIKRCHWCGKDDLYIKYHDEEWGKEVYDDKILFEFFLCPKSTLIVLSEPKTHYLIDR